MNTITKRCAALLLSTALLVPLLAPSSRAATSVNVSVNGTPVAFSSATGTPFLDQNGRTQVPLRVTMEAMGATVGWDNAARTATVSKGSVSIRIPIGTSFILVNGVKKSNDTTAQIVNGRTYLPIRIVAESLSATVSWNSSTKSVQITAKGTPKVWLLTSDSYENTTYSYDSANRLLSKTGIAGFYRYRYNAQDQIISETWTPSAPDAQNYHMTTAYQYNHWGLVSHQDTTSTEPEEDVCTEQDGNKEVWFEYNDHGDVTKELHHFRESGPYPSWLTTTHSYTYDKNGRVTRDYIVNPCIVTQDLYPDTQENTYTYDASGKLTKLRSITNFHDDMDGKIIHDTYTSDTTHTFSYDANGNLTKEVISFDGAYSVTHHYTYTQR